MTERRIFYKRYIQQQVESRGSSEDDPCLSEEYDSDKDPAWEPENVGTSNCQTLNRLLSIGPQPRKKIHITPHVDPTGETILAGAPDVYPSNGINDESHEARQNTTMEHGTPDVRSADRNIVLEESIREEPLPPHFDINVIVITREALREVPENFTMEGSMREEPLPRKKRENKQKMMKVRRNTGLPYTREKSMNIVGPRSVKQRCRGEPCEKAKRACKLFSEEERSEIFQDYWNLGNVALQRQFISRHVTINNKKVSTTVNSRRQKSATYTLSRLGTKETVCKKFFLNTLSISEAVVKTTMDKLQDTGVLQPERRGGRTTLNAERDEKKKKLILAHINRFPRVESHYCRSDTKREYLHPDLTLNKMFEIYKSDNPEEHIGSRENYRKLFASLNLSFHSPKKDQCTLCMTYKSGDESTKERLKENYEKHTAEKEMVRKLKANLKREGMVEKTKGCLVFDLQQVIYLPRTNENAVFYKRRLSTFNFTIYDVVTKECYCFTWNETISKRGACEIASCLYKVIQDYDRRGFVTLNFFSDGCAGQNKNSMVAAMFLYALHNSTGISEITLKFFEPNHGQNEGDSVHSAIGQAINRAGDLFIPSQLTPIITLARRRQPYRVYPMETQDFYDFKDVAKELKLLDVRTDYLETSTEISFHFVMALCQSFEVQNL
uniref:Uncharacterized protein n=1 Tax=Cacopsylla melanoneura TaxID=428564 RepID=A0A8D8X2V7_9HEMI